MSGKVLHMFGAPIAERVAERIVPAARTPSSLADFTDAGELQVARDRQVDRLGTWLAVGGGVLTYFLVRDWRLKRRPAK
jgi:hypothetical protein